MDALRVWLIHCLGGVDRPKPVSVLRFVNCSFNDVSMRKPL